MNFTNLKASKIEAKGTISKTNLKSENVSNTFLLPYSDKYFSYFNNIIRNIIYIHIHTLDAY